MKRSGMRIAVIGAGSSYTPMIVRELCDRRERLPVEQLTLFDIDAERLSVVAGFCRRVFGRNLPIRTTRRLHTAVADADFVLSQFRVGGLAARHQDIRLGLRYGLLGQETTGVGGFAKALRTIPATLALCRAVRKYAAKDAWLLNFTNPSGIITEAVLKHGGVKVIGLCNGPWGTKTRVAEALHADIADVELDYVGANHLAWVRGVRVKGRDCTARLRRAHAQHLASNIPELAQSPVFERTVGLPYSGYLNYYYYTDAALKKLQSSKRTRAQETLAIERSVFKKYADKKVTEVPAELSRRGGGGYNLVAADLLETIVLGLKRRHIVSTANCGAVDRLLPDAVVEINCRITREKVTPVPFGTLEPQFRGLLQVVKACEELTVTAGVKGDLEAALHALVLHPLGPTAGQATKLLKELIRINRQYLPQFTDVKMRRFFKRSS